MLFLLDRLFLLPEVRLESIQPGGMMYYKQRESMVRTVKERASQKVPGEKLAVVFGDSRSFAIGNVPARYVGKTDWNIFNFSGPQAVVAYHDYLSEEIFTGANRPGYVILGLSLDAFNRNSDMFFHPVMNYGLSGDYINRHASHIPDRIMDRYIESRRYAFTGLQFSLKHFFSRLKASLTGEGNNSSNTEALLFMKAFMVPGDKSGTSKDIATAMMGVQSKDLRLMSFHNSPEKTLLDKSQGAQYAWFGTRSNEELKADADRIGGIYLASFAISEEQFYYLESLMKRLELSGARTIVFQPIANPYIQELYKSDPRIQGIWDRVERIVESHGGIAVDLNQVPQASCNRYYDASHLSIECFPAITRYLLNRLEEDPQPH